MLSPFFSPSLSSVVRERRRQSEHSAVQCFNSLSLSQIAREFCRGEKVDGFSNGFAFFEFFCLGFYGFLEKEEEEEEEEVA